MKVLLRLYPAWWRQRYGAEALEILERQPTTLASVWDVVLGAIDAWSGQKVPSSSISENDKPLVAGSESSHGQESLAYERYELPPPLLQPMLIGSQPPWAGDRTWEWKEYLGLLWIPWLLVVLLAAHWLSDRGVAPTVVQLAALAACFGLYLALALVDIADNHWAMKRGSSGSGRLYWSLSRSSLARSTKPLWRPSPEWPQSSPACG